MSSVDFNGISGLQQMDGKSDGVNERLTKKIIELIRGEIAKTETQQKLRCAVDPIITPIISHVSNLIQPYLLLFIVTIFLILIFQAYMIHKMWHLQRFLK